MNVIFLYGPPAVGKLTVAQRLAKLTGYKIFHNHLTVDLVGSLFEFGSIPFAYFNKKLRLELIKGAIEFGIDGIIFTFCYKNNRLQNDFIKAFMTLVKKSGGTMWFVSLTATPQALAKRVKSQTRKHTTKIKTVKLLKTNLEQLGLVAQIPYVKSLTIDNTKKSSTVVAKQIIKTFGISKKSEHCKKN